MSARIQPGRRRLVATTLALAIPLTLAPLLSACSQLPRLPQQGASPQAMQASGRLAVRMDGQADRSFSASFDLTGTPEAGRLTLGTPFGTQLAQAQWQPGRAWLSSPEGVREFADVEALAERTLGERLPLPALFDWLQGQPWRGAPSRLLNGPVFGFEQLGWIVDTSGLPGGALTASRQSPRPVHVRARLDAPLSPLTTSPP